MDRFWLCVAYFFSSVVCVSELCILSQQVYLYQLNLIPISAGLILSLNVEITGSHWSERLRQFYYNQLDFNCGQIGASSHK
jgi:hypothetical protein